MAARAELRGVLKLDNLQFVRTIRSSIKLAQDLARSFRRNPFQSSFVAGAMAARRSVQLAARGIEGLGSVSKSVFTRAAVGAVAVAGAIGLIAKKTIDAAAQVETFETSFEVLLGGAGKAKQRMKELIDFANKTPFELEEVATASRVLEVFTAGALSTGKGLRIVGDLAAGVNIDFEQTAITVGRLFDALRSGRPAGESLFSLQQMGAMSGSARRQVEALGHANRGAEAWVIAQQEFARFDGMMMKRSKTWEGRMSTFRDAVRDAMRQFGTPLIKELGPFLEIAAKSVGTLAPQLTNAGREFAKGVKGAVEFTVAVFQDPAKLLDPFVTLLRVGLLGAGNLFAASIKTGANIIASAEFFTSLAKAFGGLTKIISGNLMLAFQKPIAYLIAGIEKAFDFTWSWREGAKWHGGSVEGRAQQMLKTGKTKRLAQDTIEQGYAGIRSASKSLFDRIGEGILNFNVDDVMNASATWKRAKNKFQFAVSAGRSAIAAASQTSPALGQMRGWEGWRASVHGIARNANTGLVSGGLSGGGLESGGLGMRGVRTTPLLRLRERRAFENERIAGMMAAGVMGARTGSTAQAFGAVRRGDRERMREFQREKLREKEGIEKTNSILEAIKTRFDELVR